MKTLLNQPVKGTKDWFPEEYQIRKYIFDAWRKVCSSFGYQEYLTPIVENADIYKAKSGQDVGGKELMIFKDKADKELSIRPEMTPSVTRMLTQKYMTMTKPVRFFSIANFWRNEKPQRGRNREFWQLNFDIFGSDALQADVEILQMAIEIMLAFNPAKNSFEVKINNRKLIDDVLSLIPEINDNNRIQIVRILDKFDKENQKKTKTQLNSLGIKKIEKVLNFMNCKNENDLIQIFPELKNQQSIKTIINTKEILSELGYKNYIKFNPSIIRGFDYYDGMIFEIFDKNPENNRSLFGGGRYNSLAGLFGSQSFPAVGCAPGDEAIRLFLESWGLLDKIKQDIKQKKYYLPILSDECKLISIKLANNFRKQGKIVEQGLQIQTLNKALDYANKKQFNYVIILGEKEKTQGKVSIKDMNTGEQFEMSLKF